MGGEWNTRAMDGVGGGGQRRKDGKKSTTGIGASLP